MDNAEQTKKAFGATSDELLVLRRRDAVLDELLSDYQSLSNELRRLRDGGGSMEKTFWVDTLETLHALDGEIRSRLALAKRNDES